MTLHFFDAHTYPLSHPGTGFQFLYQAVDYNKPYYIRIEMNQNIESLPEPEQKKQLMQQAFGVALELIQTTWRLNGLLPIGKIPYREFIEFRVANQLAVDWHGYRLNLGE